MGGDVAQRRQFLLDATQGLSLEAVIDLVKAAAATEQQHVSHSMLRLLSKLAKHADSAVERQRFNADKGLRETVSRLVGEWGLDDPNPEGYRAVLEQVSHVAGLGTGAFSDSPPIECEPQRIVQMSLEIGVVGPTLWRAVDRLEREAKYGALLDLLDGAPNRTAAAEVLQHLALRETLRRMLGAERIDFLSAGRLVKHQGAAAVSTLLEVAEEIGDLKTRERIYDLVASSGSAAPTLVAARLNDAARDGAAATVQRELLALLGRLHADEGPVAKAVDLERYLSHTDVHVRREALKMLLRGPRRDEALRAALADSDERIVYVAFTAAHERSTPQCIALIRTRVDQVGLDPSIRALGIRAVATSRTPETLEWLISRVITKGFFGRPKLQPATPETLAALSAIVGGWRQDPVAATVLELAGKSRDQQIRSLVKA
jgi:hypothetical protein